MQCVGVNAGAGLLLVRLLLSLSAHACDCACGCVGGWVGGWVHGAETGWLQRKERKIEAKETALGA